MTRDTTNKRVIECTRMSIETEFVDLGELEQLEAVLTQAEKKHTPPTTPQRGGFEYNVGNRNVSFALPN